MNTLIFVCVSKVGTLLAIFKYMFQTNEGFEAIRINTLSAKAQINTLFIING
jgi:hypothetical protein|tara:strand:+ start:568 stop:723 length:156 start_codon:yes stop_codon:yes gene_type:complete